MAKAKADTKKSPKKARPKRVSIETLARRCGITDEQTAELLVAMVEEIKNGVTVSAAGFGSFIPKKTPYRKFYTPLFGDTVQQPKKYIGFKQTRNKALTEYLNS